MDILLCIAQNLNIYWNGIKYGFSFIYVFLWCKTSWYRDNFPPCREYNLAIITKVGVMNENIIPWECVIRGQKTIQRIINGHGLRGYAHPMNKQQKSNFLFFYSQKAYVSNLLKICLQFSGHGVHHRIITNYKSGRYEKKCWKLNK